MVHFTVMILYFVALVIIWKKLNIWSCQEKTLSGFYLIGSQWLGEIDQVHNNLQYDHFLLFVAEQLISNQIKTSEHEPNRTQVKQSCPK